MASPMSRRSAPSTTMSAKPSDSSDSEACRRRAATSPWSWPSSSPTAWLSSRKPSAWIGSSFRFCPSRSAPPTPRAGWRWAGGSTRSASGSVARGSASPGTTTPSNSWHSRTAPCRSNTSSGIISSGRRISLGWSKAEATRSTGSSAIAAVSPWSTVKDIAPSGDKTDEDGWADVGTGTLPWGELWRLCAAAGADVMIAEHDNPSDFDRFARVSAEAMRRLGEGSAA